MEKEKVAKKKADKEVLNPIGKRAKHLSQAQKAKNPENKHFGTGAQEKEKEVDKKQRIHFAEGRLNNIIVQTEKRYNQQPQREPRKEKEFSEKMRRKRESQQKGTRGYRR